MLEMRGMESLADVASALETGAPAMAREAAAETGVPAMASAVETEVPAVAREAAAMEAGVTTIAPTLRKGLRRTVERSKGQCYRQHLRNCSHSGVALPRG